MNTRNILAKLSLAIALAAAINGSLASAQRGNPLVVSRTADGADTDTFTPQDKVIYCVLSVPNADPKGTYKFIWGRYVQGMSTPKTIFQEELTAQNGRVVSKFSSSSDLPAGDYSINVWTPSGHRRKAFAVK